MQTIINAEEVFNEHWGLVGLIYQYEDGSTKNRIIFVPAAEATKED